MNGWGQVQGQQPGAERFEGRAAVGAVGKERIFRLGKPAKGPGEQTVSVRIRSTLHASPYKNGKKTKHTNPESEDIARGPEDHRDGG